MWLLYIANKVNASPVWWVANDFYKFTQQTFLHRCFPGNSHCNREAKIFMRNACMINYINGGIKQSIQFKVIQYFLLGQLNKKSWMMWCLTCCLKTK